MKKRILKLIILVFSILLLSTFIPIQVDAAVPAEYQTCGKIDEYIEKAKRSYESAVSGGSPLTAQLYRAYQEAKQWKEDNCNSCAVHDFDDRNLGIGLDQSGYILHKYTDGDTGIFCIDPDHVYKHCAEYHRESSNLASNPKIAKLIKAYQELGGNSGSDDLYIGTQLYIWDILGLHRTIGGSTYQHIRDVLNAKIVLI